MKNKKKTIDDIDSDMAGLKRKLSLLSKTVVNLKLEIDLLKGQKSKMVLATLEDLKRKNIVAYTIEDVREAANDWLRAIGETELVQSESRKLNIKIARHVSWIILRDMGYSTIAIGEAYNNNHSTVVVAVTRARELVSINDITYVNAYKGIKQILEVYYGDGDKHTADKGEGISKLKESWVA